MTTPSHRTIIAASVLGLAALVTLALVIAPWRSSKSSEPETQALVEDAGASRGSGKRQRPMLEPVAGSGVHLIDGFVRDAQGQPIAHAQVSATLELGPGVAGETPDEGEVVVALSDANGAFQLKGLIEGRHRVRIEGEGILPAELRFVEAPGQGLVILVSREVHVSGRLIGPVGNPSLVRVYLRSENQTRTDDRLAGPDGVFEFSGLPEGRYQVWAHGPGQASSLVWVERRGAGPFADVAVPLAVAHTLRGRVVESGGTGLGLRTQVTVRSADGSEPERRAFSQEDGSFAVEGLLDGRWTIEATAPGYVPSATQSFLAESGAELLVEVNTGGRVSGVARSSQGGVLSGVTIQLVGTGPDGETRRYGSGGDAGGIGKTLASGQTFIERGELGVLLGPIPLVPPRGAYVSRVARVLSPGDGGEVEEEPLGNPSQFVTDGLGRFFVSGVLPGRYRIEARHPDYADTITPEFPVQGLGPWVRRNVVLKTGTRLTGQVLTDDGVAIAGASVFAKFSDSRVPELAVSDDDGRFSFEPLAGTIDLVVEAVGYGRAKQRLKLSGGGLVAASREAAIRLERADRTLEARLVDAAGFPVRGARIAVEENERGLPVRPVQSNEEGIFRIEGLVSGAHTLQIRHDDFPPLQIARPAETGMEIVVPMGAELRLLVEDSSSGTSLAMVSVMLAHAGGTEERRGFTDASGQASFAAMSPGAWTISASLAGYATASVKAGLAAKTQRDSPPKLVTLALDRGSILAGIVVDRDGERVDGAQVWVGDKSATTDANGRFRLEDVASGSVELVIEKGGARTREPLVLESGEERVTMELRFAPANAEGEDGEEGETEEESDEADDETADD